jgi:ankyrin repeat protein
VTISPCDADWDEMIGNDQVRFCDHCNLHVTNISSLTARDAERLVRESQGRLCLRIVQTATGEVLTQGSAKLDQLGRRVSRLAASAFTATLSLSSAAAQTGSPVPNPESKIAGSIPQSKKIEGGAGSKISGLVKDPNDAVIVGAKITLTNVTTGSETTTESSDVGEYSFPDIAAGNYKITVKSPGFAAFEIVNLNLQSASGERFEAVLQPEVRVTMGVVAIVEPKDPFIKAAYKNDLVTVKTLIPVTEKLDKNDKDTGINALSYAITNNNREMVNALLLAGADINYPDASGRTPIMSVNDETKASFLRGLISAGADVNARDQQGVSVVMTAAGSWQFDVFKELISAGARIDVHDASRNSVLMLATMNPDTKIVKFLIEAGVNIEATNDQGESALSFAARWGKATTLRALINAGAAINLSASDLNQALLNALSGDDSAGVKVLLETGADANAMESDSMTALMVAAQNAKPDAVKALVRAGAKINEIDEDGWTALMHVQDVESARILLNAGADMTVKNNEGKTALRLAIESDQEDIVKLLKSRGAPE